METARLNLVRMTPDDWSFVLRLLNEPEYIENIRDSGVRDEAQARKFIQDFYVASYEKNGFGLYGIELRSTGEKIGICGLIRREGLDGVDLGFALLSAHHGKGYALEAASATVEFAKSALHLPRILAIISDGNHPSIRLVEKLGFSHERRVALTAGGPELKLYSKEL